MNNEIINLLLQNHKIPLNSISISQNEVNKLIALGFPIKIENNNLCLLNEINRSLITYGLKKKIDVETYNTISSTNTYCRKRCFQNDTLVCSSHQENGRGRKGKSFFSPPDGLYFTLSMKTDNIDISNATIIAALSITKALNKLYQIDCMIKWVNDIYYQGKKVAGILSEAFTDNNSLILLIGIGININQNNFPDEINSIATSLFIPDCNRSQLISEIINNIYQLFNVDKATIIEEYRHKMFLIGKEVSFTINNVSYVGEAIDINEEGNLIVNCNNKNIILKSGEISLGSKQYK